MTHMGQDIDRGVGEEFDVVGAARQRAFNIAGVQHVEEIQHALTMRFLGHSSLSALVRPDSRGQSIVQRNGGGINQQKDTNYLAPVVSKRFTAIRVLHAGFSRQDGYRSL